MNKVTIVAATLATAGLALTACSGDDESGGTAAPSAPATSPAPATTSAAAMDKPFGAACSAVPSAGKGSFQGMATDPVATAASNNPVLSTLVTAVKKAGLVDALNGSQNITVFAPTNDAFNKIPKATLDKVLADKKTLTDILTYHVVGRRIAPAGLAAGDFTTLQGGKVSTSGSGESYTVKNAGVVCGNVQTANATVYIIDTVLMPK